MTDRDLTPSELWMRRLADAADWPDGDPGACPDDEALARRLEARSVDPSVRAALDAHLTRCDACREAVADLILDGAGEHLPMPGGEPSPAARTPWWASTLEVFLPRRLVAGLTPALVAALAVTALAAVALPVARRLLGDGPGPAPAAAPGDDRPAGQGARPVRRVRTLMEPPPAAFAPGAEDGAPAASAEAVGRRTPAFERRARPASSPVVAAAASDSATSTAPPALSGPAVVLPKLEPAPVIVPPPAVESPPPPAIQVDDEAHTGADGVIEDELTAILLANGEGRHRDALARIDRAMALTERAHWRGILERQRRKAVDGLKRLQGPCKDGYVWQTVRRAVGPNQHTVVQRCVLPESVTEILDHPRRR